MYSQNIFGVCNVTCLQNYRVQLRNLVLQTSNFTYDLQIALPSVTGTFQRQRVDTDEKDALTQWQCIHQQWVNSPVSQKVMLLYSRDSAPFCEVVQAFRHLLQSFGNIKVIYDVTFSGRLTLIKSSRGIIRVRAITSLP